MFDCAALTAQDFRDLSPDALAHLAEQMLAQMAEQRRQLEERDRQIAEQTMAIQFKDAKIEKILFELRRLKAWKFGARTERMDAAQRQLFEETLAEDEADLQAQLHTLQGQASAPPAWGALAPGSRKPRRQALPEHLRRIEHRHEPQSTTCPSANCGRPMTRIGEDVSETLDIIPAEFFVHRHIRGKWACKCCQTLVQEPVDPRVVDRGIPAAGLLAHTLVSRFVDHLPYYRQEQINARSNVHTSRATLAAWAGQTGAALQPLFDAHRAFVLGAQVLHADETPVSMLDPGAGKTRRAYVWTYARGAFDHVPGVLYDFCPSRAARHPVTLLAGWSGTLVCDGYGAYDSVLKQEQRSQAGCMAHARRKFDELAKDGQSMVATLVLQRIAWLYRIEREAREMTADDRWVLRERHARPVTDELLQCLRHERDRVPNGSAIAKAIDYSLKRWDALTHYLQDGNVPIDNNHCENLIRPWAMGRKAWLFAGSELAGQRAAMVMSLLQSAKLNGHDPWAYLKDVLTRLPMHLNSRITELLPHRWHAAV